MTDSRFAQFDSSAAEYKKEPIGFVLDGTTWVCHPEPTAAILKMVQHDTNSFELIAASVVEPDAWQARVEQPDNPILASLARDIAQSLIFEYFGVEVGKSASSPRPSSRTGGGGKPGSGKSPAATRKNSPRAKSSPSRTARS